MVWTINYSERALKSLRKMDKQIARRIVDFMDLRIAALDDPRQSGKSLKGELGEFWRYRVGDYRILCEIRDDELVILAATIGHRKEIYDKSN
ncbi:type II toxin-antitoxin system RelE family toxin [Morganella morganii]|nr:type II toxin-antitoxin system RelE/ParE family toxin [Providencia rettgeri]